MVMGGGGGGGGGGDAVINFKSSKQASMFPLNP